MNSPSRLAPHATQNITTVSSPHIANLFGTDGIRARVGTFPFTDHDLIKLGRAIGIWATEKYGNNPRLLIGHDTRESTSFMINALTIGLLESPVSLFNTGILPTPAIIKLATLDPNIDSAIIITASHNPYHDNGIKLVDKHAGKLSTSDEEMISELFYKNSEIAHEIQGKIHALSDAQESYTKALLSYFAPQFLSGKKIILDCAHGATSEVAPIIFQSLGATVHAISNQPNGRNINDQCGATHPGLLARIVIEENADIGFAFDGDGDRVVAVNKQGAIKDGDDILALLLDHPIYALQPTLVCTIMSNAGLDEFVKNKQKNIIRTPVGDKHVSAELKSKNLLIGGEQSGHILLADFLNSGDGIFAALRICEVAAASHNWDLVSFDHMAQIMINVPVEYKRDLKDPELQEIIAAAKAQLGEGALVIRYSGTENILRIMIQHKDPQHATHVSMLLVEKMKNALQN